jgi:catechol 2,3-dioxygenase-like lactoylglutathione lyase family enzyme
MIVGLFHFGATVSNLEKTLEFFGSKLGITNIKSQLSDQPYLAKVTGLPDAKLKIGFLRIEGDDFPLEVIEYITPKGVDAGSGFGISGTIHYAFLVNNLYELFAHLKEEEISFLAPPYLIQDGLWEGWLSAFLHDPDGRLIELVQPPEMTQGEGRLVRIHHIGITCSDLQPIKALLGDKLGLAFQKEMTFESGYLRHVVDLPDYGLDAAYLKVPGTQAYIELWKFHTPAGPPARAIHNNVGSGHLCFLVDDMQSDYEMLKQAGVDFVGPPARVTAGVNEGGYAIYFAGPDEVRFELFQNPA